MWEQRHSSQHTSTVSAGGSGGWPRPLIQLAATPQPWVQQQVSIYACLPQGSLLHQPAQIFAQCESLLTDGCSPRAGVTHRQCLPLCVGGLVHLFRTYAYSLAARLLSSTEETSRRLLSQWGYPTSACLLTRNGTWGIGETLLWWHVVKGYTTNILKKIWEMKT